jgi:hypothetical protein
MRIYIFYLSFLFFELHLSYAAKAEGTQSVNHNFQAAGSWTTVSSSTFTVADGHLNCTMADQGSSYRGDLWYNNGSSAALDLSLDPAKDVYLAIKFMDEKNTTIQHPCMLHTEADFAFVKAKVAAGAQPWANAFNHLEQNRHAQSTWVATPVKKLARLDATNWAALNSRWVNAGIEADWYEGIHTNYTNLMRDAAAAYQLALRWKISGNDAFATAGINILNAWAQTCVGYIVNATTGLFVDPNEYLIAIQIHQLANAGEILGTSGKWAAADFGAFKKWMVDVFYGHASGFLQSHESEACPMHAWLNWDLANMTAVLSIGILTDNYDMINEAVDYFKRGVGAGGIKNAVPFLHQDPDSDEILGQSNESGRDQGHATLCVSLMGVLCQMAKNIGIDLFTYDSNRAHAMCEYTAKYNIGASEGSGNYTMTDFTYDGSLIPYTHYTNCEYDKPVLSSDGRGSIRPAWELIHRLSSEYGLPDIYTQQWVTKMRQNVLRHYSDGGAGDYGSNSGGYDQLGFGTLMFAVDGGYGCNVSAANGQLILEPAGLAGGMTRESGYRLNTTNYPYLVVKVDEPGNAGYFDLKISSPAKGDCTKSNLDASVTVKGNNSNVFAFDLSDYRTYSTADDVSLRLDFYQGTSGTTAPTSPVKIDWIRSYSSLEALDEDLNGTGTNLRQLTGEWDVTILPANGKIALKGIEQATIEVFNFSGQKVAEVNAAEVSLPAGNYIVKVTANGITKISKAIIK